MCHKTVDKSGPQRVLNILGLKYAKNISKTVLESHDNRLSNEFLCTLFDPVVEEIFTIQVEVSNLINSFVGHCTTIHCIDHTRTTLFHLSEGIPDISRTITN